jgi:iodotyrosine deiodinase
MSESDFMPLEGFVELAKEEMCARAENFRLLMRRRRTVRNFSDRPLPREVVELCIRTAGTSPSGANKQPWHFIVVSNQDMKHKIREAAEKEEHEFYHGRASQEWLDALAPLGTDESKPFLEVAPYLIVIMEEKYGLGPDGQHIKHYYVNESVGIATGVLIAAFHNAGCVSLTHTPCSMKFLNPILGRPENERPFLILAVGYPAENAKVPRIERKTLAQIATFI